MEDEGGGQSGHRFFASSWQSGWRLLLPLPMYLGHTSALWAPSERTSTTPAPHSRAPHSHAPGPAPTSPILSHIPCPTPPSPLQPSLT